METSIFKIILLAWVMIPGAIHATNRISIGDALNKKLISCTLQTTGDIPDSLTERSGHILKMSFQSLTPNPLEILLESGQRFISMDSAIQNLMITEGRVIALKGGKNSSYEVVAYCINQHRTMVKGRFYTVGSIAKGMLLKVANFLGKRKVRCDAAPKAIWVITDNNSIEEVKGRNNYETRMVRNFLYDLTGRERPPRNIEPLSYPSVLLSGEIAWTMPEPGTISLVVLDSNNNRLGCLINNQPYKKGKQYYTFLYKDDVLLPDQNYRLILLKEDTLLKEFAVKSKEE